MAGERLSPPEHLSHHCTYGSRIQRFIKMWGNFLVISKQRLIPSFTQTFQGNGSNQNRTLSRCPSTHPGSAPLISMFRINSQLNQVFPFPFRFLPVMPNAVPQPVSQPSVQFLQFAMNISHSEVIEPALGNFFEFSDAFVETHLSSFFELAVTKGTQFLVCDEITTSPISGMALCDEIPACTGMTEER